jgi:SEC-C motif-containing protein
MPNCPCGSNKNYGECCGIYINDQAKPETPEELMRSRYTAYTQANIDYIRRTMKAPALNHFNAESAKQWAMTVQWLGLEVIRSSLDNAKGYVEFIAHFSAQSKKDSIHELSEFHALDGQWYYVDGKHNQPKPHTKVKIGRNDPCSCGSGKKYKACCLNKRSKVL